jgi:hypothetical protein
MKHVILSEFCLNTQYNRNYAIRLLNGPPPGENVYGCWAGIHAFMGHRSFRPDRDLEGHRLSLIPRRPSAAPSCRLASGMTEQNFRRIMGHRDLWMLTAILDENQHSLKKQVA